MTSSHFVETPVTINSPPQDSLCPDGQIPSRYVIPRFKTFLILIARVVETTVAREGTGRDGKKRDPGNKVVVETFND